MKAHSIIDDFINTAMGYSKNAVAYYLEEIRQSDFQSTSGNAYSVEKEGDLINIECLFDETQYTSIRIDDFVMLLQKHQSEINR